MLKRKLSESDWLLILANILPIVGVLFHNWSPHEIFLVYASESLIIGGITIIKLIILTITRKTDWWEKDGNRIQQSGVVFILFFVVHYGLFMVIQMGMFFSLSNMNSSSAFSFFTGITKPFTDMTGDGVIMMCAFILGYGVQNLAGFIMNNEYKEASFMKVMFEPYIRVFVQQLTVIFGGMFLAFGAGKIFIIIFAFVKIYCTIYLNFGALLRKSLSKASGQDNNNSHS